MFFHVFNVQFKLLPASYQPPSQIFIQLSYQNPAPKNNSKSSKFRAFIFGNSRRLRQHFSKWGAILQCEVCCKIEWFCPCIIKYLEPSHCSTALLEICRQFAHKNHSKLEAKCKCVLCLRFSLPFFPVIEISWMFYLAGEQCDGGRLKSPCVIDGNDATYVDDKKVAFYVNGITGELHNLILNLHFSEGQR